jgi:hypothetical protein
MIYLLLFGFTVYVVYTVVVALRFGIPKSYSDTYYLFDRKWYFSAVMATIAITGMISGLDTGGYWNFLAFIPAAALMFVSAAPDFKYKGKRKPLVNKVHMRASYIAVLGSCFAFWLKFGYLWVAVPFFAFVVIMAIWRPKSYLFWIEHICFDIYFMLLLISTL